MNERIKELAEQAEIGTELYDGWGRPYIDKTFDKEKFAELIVSECVKVAMRSVGDDEPKEAWYLIREHFGVEE